MKKIIEKMIKLGLTPKREFLILLVFNLVFIGAFVAIAISIKNYLICAIGPGFALVFTIFFLNRYDAKLNKIQENNLLEFSELFSFFRIYVKNGYNVYNAIKEITNFANENLRQMLEKLLEEIDEDKSVKPFVKFARNFNEIIIEELMISIYQMIDDGEQSNYLVQFEFIFDKFSESLSQKQLRKKFIEFFVF